MQFAKPREKKNIQERDLVIPNYKELYYNKVGMQANDDWGFNWQMSWEDCSKLITSIKDPFATSLIPQLALTDFLYENQGSKMPLPEQ